jgi:hypothetical protein
MLLTDDHRQKAAQRIATELIRLAAGMNMTCPRTWVIVAVRLRITPSPYPMSDKHPPEKQSRGWLVHNSARDAWVIEWNTGLSEREQSEAIVHELAHWFQRAATSEWVCNEPAVYWYEGPDDERHRIARLVESLVFA